MKKQCPFLNQACLKESCQLWVRAASTNEKSYDCAFASLVKAFDRDMGSVTQFLGRIASKP